MALFAVRTPRLRVLAGGAELPGALAADVFANSHLSTDRFRVRFAASALGEDGVARLRDPDGRIEVQVALEADGWVSLIVGRVDSLSFDAVHQVLEVEGRDLAAVLVEAQVGEAFANQTASEIVATVAARHGLEADVTATSEAVGRFYQAGHERLTLAQHARATTEWDLLTWLAGQEGFLLGMVGARLRFGKRNGDAVELAVADCSQVEVTQQPGLLRPIEVVVRSWGTRRAQAVEGSARSGGEGAAFRQVVTRPNLTSAEAERLAGRILDDLRRHARGARVVMPGELTLGAQGVVALSGAGPGWDGRYAVLGVDRHLDARRGFSQSVELQGMIDGSAA